MELNEKESHCVARLLQGAFYGESAVSGCAFCKYRCRESDEISMERKIREKFMAETGVDLTQFVSPTIPYSKFPYKKFLKNSNENIKEYFRKIFADELN